MCSEEQFRSAYENTLMKLEVFKHETDDKKSIALCLNVLRNTVITDKTIESLTAQAHNKCNGMIIVTKVVKKNGAIAVDNKALDAVKMVNQSKFLRIEFFKEENLMFSLLEHELVPEHKLITEEEKRALLDK